MFWTPCKITSVYLVLENVAVAALDDSLQEEIAVQSIVSVQSYRCAVHIAFKSIEHRRGTFPTASTFELTGALRQDGPGRG